MKKMINLGKSLSKMEQKKINGGYGGAPTCDCNSLSDCSSGYSYCVNCSGPVGGKYGKCSTSAA